MKICDFGFSRYVAYDKTMTMCGTVRGARSGRAAAKRRTLLTRLHRRRQDFTLAPEIMFCMDYTESVDVFSFGMVLCEMLSCHRAATFERVVPGFGIREAQVMCMLQAGGQASRRPDP